LAAKWYMYNMMAFQAQRKYGGDTVCAGPFFLIPPGNSIIKNQLQYPIESFFLHIKRKSSESRAVVAGLSLRL
jgi:hypothetical protein